MYVTEFLEQQRQNRMLKQIFIARLCHRLSISFKFRINNFIKSKNASDQSYHNHCIPCKCWFNFMEQKSKSLLAIFKTTKSTSSNAIYYDYKQTICDALWTLFEKGDDPQQNQFSEKTAQWLNQWIYEQIILINTYFIQQRKLCFISLIIDWPWITNMLFKINSCLICCTVEYWICQWQTVMQQFCGEITSDFITSGDIFNNLNLFSMDGPGRDGF